MRFFELSSSNYGNKRNQRMPSMPSLAHGLLSILPRTRPVPQGTHTSVPSSLSLAVVFPQYKFCISSLLVIFPTGLGV